MIREVSSGSVAFQTGLLAGDVIVALNGQPITSKTVVEIITKQIQATTKGVRLNFALKEDIT